MFDITGKSIAYPISTWILILIFLFGGTAAFSSLGRLEDPAFTIKVAAVVTSYPGASAATVGKEVSEPLESAIQKMGEVGKITSRNTPGLSIIEVEIKDTIKGDKLPGIWTKLRARVQDTELYLPEGVQTPIVNDDFGDVFGIYFAVTADGYSDREKHDLATYLRRLANDRDGAVTPLTARKGPLPEIGEDKKLQPAPIALKTELHHGLAELFFAVGRFHAVRLVNNINAVRGLRDAPENFADPGANFPSVAIA